MKSKIVLKKLTVILILSLTFINYDHYEYTSEFNIINCTTVQIIMYNSIGVIFMVQMS